LGISHRLLYIGERVNIRGFFVAGPSAFSSVRGVVAKYHLQPCPKWQLFHDLTKAPAGNLGDAITVSRQPARAV